VDAITLNEFITPRANQLKKDEPALELLQIAAWMLRENGDAGDAISITNIIEVLEGRGI